MHTQTTLYLDNEYNIRPNSWIVIQTPEESDSPELEEPNPKVVKPDGVATPSIAAYGLSGKATRLDLGEETWLPADDADFSIIRGTVVYAQSEELTLAEAPIDDIVGKQPNQTENQSDQADADTDKASRRIELNGLYEGLESGRWVIVSGERDDIPGVISSELIMLAGVEQTFRENLPNEKPHTTIILANSLAYSYKRDTVTIYGNVVKSTHGETRAEVLGSGDGSKVFQQFMFKQPPLTYLAAPTAIGSASTLEVRVNEVLWHEADTFVGLTPTSRSYVLRIDGNSNTTVTFGDGQTGSRLPTGMGNIKAVYRSGIGKVGNVKPEQISVLATRPLGLKGVINPLTASGGADRESRDSARHNIPLAVMALDRLVSTQDYADFARTFAGIGKASAQELSNGRQSIVHVTIAGDNDIPIDTNSDLYQNLLQAFRKQGDPYQPIQLVPRELMVLILVASIRVLPDYLWELLEPKIRATLLNTFSFERRDLGQSVSLSEVISTIQHVPGVDFVDVDIFDSISETVARTLTTESETQSLMSVDALPERVTLTQKLNEIITGAYSVEDVSLTNEIDSRITLLSSTNEQVLSPPKQPRQSIAVHLARREAGKNQPAQLAIFAHEISDTLILKEWKA